MPGRAHPDRGGDHQRVQSLAAADGVEAIVRRTAGAAAGVGVPPPDLGADSIDCWTRPRPIRPGVTDDMLAICVIRRLTAGFDRLPGQAAEETKSL